MRSLCARAVARSFALRQVFLSYTEELSVDTGCTTLRFLSKRLPPLLNASLTCLALILAPSRPFLVFVSLRIQWTFFFFHAQLMCLKITFLTDVEPFEGLRNKSAFRSLRCATTIFYGCIWSVDIILRYSRLRVKLCSPANIERTCKITCHSC